MLQAGLNVAAGSDAPVSPPDPLKGIYAAVTRTAETGQKVLPEQAISFTDAARLYTSGPAYSCFRESQLGTIAGGKYGRPGCIEHGSRTDWGGRAEGPEGRYDHTGRKSGIPPYGLADYAVTHIALELPFIHSQQVHKNTPVVLAQHWRSLSVAGGSCTQP